MVVFTFHITKLRTPSLASQLLQHRSYCSPPVSPSVSFTVTNHYSFLLSLSLYSLSPRVFKHLFFFSNNLILREIEGVLTLQSFTEKKIITGGYEFCWFCSVWLIRKLWKIHFLVWDGSSSINFIVLLQIRTIFIKVLTKNLYFVYLVYLF